MRLGVLAFLAGMLVFHTLAELPDRRWGWLLPGVLVLLRYVPCLRLPAWGLAGLLWALLRSEPLLTQLPPELESVDLQVVGWVASIPHTAYRSTRFELAVATLRQGDTPIPLTGKLRLNWYESPPPLQVGDRWELTVRLHRPHRLANPGGFDEERWLFSNGIAARGYVRPYPEPHLLQAADRYPLDRFRQHLAERFARLLPNSPYVAILTALAIGDEQGIPQRQWEIFTRTGTSHMVSVSGLHISLVAGLLFILVRRAWSRFPPLVRRWPAGKAAVLTALLGATGYTVLSGLSLPAQRSLLMLAVALVALFTQRVVAPSRILALALLAVLLSDPEAPLSSGFWLSFGAVAAILYAVVGRREEHPLREWLRLQLAVTLAMVPATLILFQQIPLLSPLANMIAIPWTDTTVVPLTLLAALAGGVSEVLQAWLLQLAALMMDWLWQFLVWLGRSRWALVYAPAPPFWTLAFALPGLLLLLAPRGLPGRWLGAVLILPLLFFPVAAPLPGVVWFTLLDVGKGLAAVVRTAHHVLVYDTGPRHGFGSDAGRTVLVPFLRQQGIRRIDTLIISQADNAHKGGTRSLLEQIKADRILTPSLQAVPVAGAEPCRAGLDWTWDGVQFRLLHPPEESLFVGADAACVLQVEGKQRLLVGGDIGSSAANFLVQTYGAGLAAEVLVAPHPDARKSLPAAFIAAVQPRYVLFSSGPREPSTTPEVLAPYREAGAVILDTAREGSITFRLNGEALQPELYRQQVRRYWQTP
jgi:competence protein ComEC